MTCQHRKLCRCCCCCCCAAAAAAAAAALRGLFRLRSSPRPPRTNKGTAARRRAPRRTNAVHPSRAHLGHTSRTHRGGRGRRRSRRARRPPRASTGRRRRCCCCRAARRGPPSSSPSLACARSAARSRGAAGCCGAGRVRTTSRVAPRPAPRRAAPPSPRSPVHPLHHCCAGSQTAATQAATARVCTRATPNTCGPVRVWSARRTRPLRARSVRVLERLINHRSHRPPNPRRTAPNSRRGFLRTNAAERHAVQGRDEQRRVQRQGQDDIPERRIRREWSVVGASAASSRLTTTSNTRRRSGATLPWRCRPVRCYGIKALAARTRWMARRRRTLKGATTCDGSGRRRPTRRAANQRACEWYARS